MSKESRKIFVEKVGYQEAVIQQLSRDGIYVEGVHPGGSDKRSRLALTTHNIKSGFILFPRTGAENLIRQLVGFGKENDNDLADAFTMLAIKLATYLHEPHPYKNLDDSNREDTRMITYDLMNMRF